MSNYIAQQKMLESIDSGSINQYLNTADSINVLLTSYSSAVDLFNTTFFHPLNK